MCYSAGATLGIPVAVPLNWGERAKQEKKLETETRPVRHWFAAAFPSALSPPCLGLLAYSGGFCSWDPCLHTQPSPCRALISLHLCQFIKRKRRPLARISTVVSQFFDLIEPCLQTFLFMGNSCSPVQWLASVPSTHFYFSVTHGDIWFANWIVVTLISSVFVPFHVRKPLKTNY